MRIFYERSLGEMLRAGHEKLVAEVESAERDYLLNTNEEQYVEYLVQRYRVEPLVVNFDDTKVTHREVAVHGSKFPSHYWVDRGQSYKKQVITYHLPYKGEGELFRCKPSAGLVWSTDVQVNRDSVCFDIINHDDNPEEIRRNADDIIKSIRRQLENVVKETVQFNASLQSEARRAVRDRKSALLKQANLVAALGVPLKQAGQVPATFALPVTQKPITIQRPAASVGPFKPEPTIEQAMYERIVHVIHEIGVTAERHSSIHRGKGEEALRDYFLAVLSPHFHFAGGEAFNKSGKTDILVRHDGRNAFAAECKFWSGPKGFHDTINQLLGYLTWRDSKAAVMMFVKNKDVSAVLQKIADETPKHPCHVKFHGKQQDGYFQYEFHLPGDPGRAVQLAVLVFHFPDV